jgi:predicted phage terminase large subunit-like protein
LASTEKERVKDDPDYSVGTAAAFDGGELYIRDVVRGQWQAPERDRRIIATASGDGPGVHVHIETVAGYKDTYTRIKQLLSGLATVRQSTPQADKVARASALEPLFEAGRVKLLRAPWNTAWLEEVASFPRGKHDDQVDSCVLAAENCMKRGGGWFCSK